MRNTKLFHEQFPPYKFEKETFQDAAAKLQCRNVSFFECHPVTK